MEIEFTFKSLRELRIGRKLSQLNLAKLSGVSREFINRVEQGHLHLSGWTAPNIALVFKVGWKSLIMAQELANHGLSESDRKGVIATALKESEGLSPGTVEIIKTVKDFDYGDRDAFGRKRKLSVYGDDAEKIAEKGKGIDQFDRDSFGRRIPKSEAEIRRKEAKKKSGELDFGDRDSFGRKIVKNAETEIDKDITLKEFFEKDESTYEERLRNLLLKGKDDKDSVSLKNIIAMKMGGDFDEDFLKSLKGLTEEEQFLAKLRRLIEKGKERREMK